MMINLLLNMVLLKKTSKYKWENGIQKDKFGVTKVKALPGVSPLVFTKFLLEMLHSLVKKIFLVDYQLIQKFLFL